MVSGIFPPGLPVPPAPPRPHSVLLPFSKAVASLESEHQDRAVPLNGTIEEITIHFPPGASGLVDVRVLYFEGNNERYVLPGIAETFIALDSATPQYRQLNYQVRKNGRVRVEWNNYDGANPHTCPVQVTIAPD